ncbi:polynucleotide 5'-hydroxyl-kinase NOL9-like, partial [Elysia marginata]
LQVVQSRDHTFLLIPSLCSTPYIHGRARITVIKGGVSVLCYPLLPGNQYDVFSPSSGSLLALNCVEKSKLKAEEVKTELAKFGVPENDKDLETLGNDTVAILMLSQLKSTVCDYITSHIPYTQLFTAPQPREKDLHSLKGITLPKLGLKLAPLKEMGPMCLNMSQDYEDVLGRFTTQIGKSTSKKAPPIWLCCGAKNSGKSTFCRMLINTALKSVKTVGYLECDVGQTEFSPPATLSFHIIDEPILGQPFCHQRQAERLVYYGEVAAGHNPSVYVKCLKHVLEAYTQLENKPPLVVNTMGFPEGIGLMLLIDTVQLVQPDIVVQIESHNQAINLPAITHELVALEEGWTSNKSQVTNPRQKMEETHPHELILLPTLLNQRRDFSLKLKPVDLRNLSLLASLSLDLEAGLTLTSMPPYAVPFRQLAMHVCHHRSLSGADILAAVDATVVALCVADISLAQRRDEDMALEFDDMPICDCLGLAIVRAIDIPRGLLYIVTTLPRVSLEKVNTILKGCVALPDQLILKQKSFASSPLPYVDALAPSTGVNAVRPRARMPRLTLGGGNNT